MSVSQMPPMGAPAAPAPPVAGAPGADDEAFISVILEVMVSSLPELIKQDPAFKKAVLDALGLSGESEDEEEGDDIDALLEGDEGGEEPADEDLDALLAGFESIGAEDDIGAL